MKNICYYPILKKIYLQFSIKKVILITASSKTLLRAMNSSDGVVITRDDSEQKLKGAQFCLQAAYV